jgi:hypothetical protein
MIHGDRVQETTLTTGTGTLALEGETEFSRSFIDAIGAGNQCHYLLETEDGGWEIGLGTVNAGSPPTLSRSLIRSVSGSLLSLASGTKYVSQVLLAATIDQKVDDDDPRLTNARTPTAHATTHVTGGSDKIRDATASQDGLMTAALVAKLDGIEAGAQVNTPQFPAGTRMLFNQTTAPTGWTKDTTAALNNSALRVVTGTAGSGGTVNFTTAFASQSVAGTIGNTTATNNSTTAGGSISVSVSVGNSSLSTAQLASHSHTAAQRGTLSAASGSAVYSASTATSSGDTGSGSSHGHSGSGSGTFTGTSHNHTQNAHNHTFTGTAIDLAVKYQDVIIASKD